MKNLIPLFCLLLVTALRAETDSVLDAVRKADDERVAAIIAADPARLGAIFSPDLRYAHSVGKVDNDASYTETLVSGATKYFSIEYVRRDFKQVAPDIVLMTGRCHIKSADRGKDPSTSLFGFLAVYREEKGAWRFLAWQSTKLAPDAPPAAH